MNEKYLIAKERGLKPYIVDGKTEGYIFYGRIPYYMGAPVSSINVFRAYIDGEQVPEDKVVLCLDTGGEYTFQEMGTLISYWWPYGIPQKIKLLTDITPGKHELTFEIATAVIYEKQFGKGSKCHLEFEV